MAYTNTESEVYAMHVVVVRCPRAFRWIYAQPSRSESKFFPCLFRAGGYFCPAAYNAPEHNRKGASNMELKVFKDTIASYGGRWETRLELPVETEILITRLSARSIQDRQVSDCAGGAAKPGGGRALAERGLSALHRLLPERGPGARLLRTEQKFAFEKSVELPAGQYAEGPAQVWGRAGIL